MKDPKVIQLYLGMTTPSSKFRFGPYPEQAVSRAEGVTSRWRPFCMPGVSGRGTLQPLGSGAHLAHPGRLRSHSAPPQGRPSVRPLLPSQNGTGILLLSPSACCPTNDLRHPSHIPHRIRTSAPRIRVALIRCRKSALRLRSLPAAHSTPPALRFDAEPTPRRRTTPPGRLHVPFPGSRFRASAPRIRAALVRFPSAAPSRLRSRLGARGWMRAARIRGALVRNRCGNGT